MTIEEKVFQRKRFVPEAMEAFGFRKTDGGYLYETAFLNGDFSARVYVTDGGTVSGTVFDNMNGEEYAPLRAERYNGAYVNKVRSAYEELFEKIADACCRDVPFASDQANRITDRIFEQYGVKPDFPWGQSPYDNAGTFRHADSGKWFALIMRIRREQLTRDGEKTPVDVMNLKIDPDEESPLRTGVYPAFHMNHKSWITVTLDDTLSDDEVMAHVKTSFRMTGKKQTPLRH
ncbi:MAG: MmcQ/YjbR family DNA-binding protein [Clostridia bacterium]|nr:MmcQ/YjbR family DNA-binding protein [Clostridia bacterium]